MKTSKTTIRRSLAAAILALACLSAAGAQGFYATSAKIDWKARTIGLEVKLDLVAAGLRLPQGRLEAERMMERDVAGLAKDAVFSIQADSYRTVGDAVADGSFDPSALVALAGIARVEASTFSKDMRSFTAVYELGLDEVAALFLSGARPSPIRAPLEERPTRDYTGIVIYAKGSLPVHGEAIEGKAAPCLFPRIYDDEMGLVLDRSLVEPEVLAGRGEGGRGEGGVLGYATAVGVDAGRRVGGDPMRVAALELFGDDRTDFVISRDDALRIMSSPGNRELLRRGKVVVVLDF
jgi:hypothetical protein